MGGRNIVRCFREAAVCRTVEETTAGSAVRPSPPPRQDRGHGPARIVLVQSGRDGMECRSQAGKYRDVESGHVVQDGAPPGLVELIRAFVASLGHDAEGCRNDNAGRDT